MVDDAAHWDIHAPRASFAPRLTEFAYFAFLLLIFVGLSPFATRDATTLIGAQSAASGAGDALRQLAYASVFAMIVYAALRDRGLRAFAGLSPSLALLLVWCLASAAWSSEPDITLRRAMLAAVVVLSATLSVSTLGAARSFQLLRWVLALMLVVNWLSIPFVHQAVHLAGDPEPQLAGDWRGLYFHKNIAGAVSALSAIVFFFAALDRPRAIDAGLCAGSIGFAVMTQSKSSLALLPVALFAGLVFRAAWRGKRDRVIVMAVLGLVAVGAIVFAIVDQSAIVRLFEDPTEFTGRAEIWQAQLAYIRDHLYLGAGFGSFSDTGDLSPLHNYVESNWINDVAHGHNAYLQLFVTIGGVGFLLAVAALILSPLIAFCRAHADEAAQMAPLFAIFVFMALHNFVESDFLEGDGPAWVVFLLMLAALRVARDADAHEADEGLQPWPVP